MQAVCGLVTADEPVTVQAIFGRHAPDGDFCEAAVSSGERYSTTARLRSLLCTPWGITRGTTTWLSRANGEL